MLLTLRGESQQNDKYVHASFWRHTKKPAPFLCERASRWLSGGLITTDPCRAPQLKAQHTPTLFLQLYLTTLKGVWGEVSQKQLNSCCVLRQQTLKILYWETKLKRISLILNLKWNCNSDLNVRVRNLNWLKFSTLVIRSSRASQCKRSQNGSLQPYKSLKKVLN